MADGRCVIDRNIPNPTEIKLVDTRKQFTDEYLTAFLISRDIGSSKDVYEDTVYNPANISIID
jgi:hypothetical protein